MILDWTYIGAQETAPGDTTHRYICEDLQLSVRPDRQAMQVHGRDRLFKYKMQYVIL